MPSRANKPEPLRDAANGSRLLNPRLPIGFIRFLRPDPAESRSVGTSAGPISRVGVRTVQQPAVVLGH